MFMGWFNQFPYTDFHELNLDFVLKNYKHLLDSLTQIDGWIEEHEKEYEELKQYVENLENGIFTPAMIAQLKQWTIKNTVDIIGAAIKMVTFGLTDSGYFVAYIPDNWQEVQFGTTGLDDFPAGVDFGHLTLSY